MSAIKNRYDFVVLFDVENGNPNGDPDAGNMPRIDPNTGYGLVTDACIKRKIRNYVDTVMEGIDGYGIYVKEGVPMNRSDVMSGEDYGVKEDLADIQKSSGDASKKIGIRMRKDDPDIELKLRDWMCSHFFDIRTFGAVMTTFTKGALNCGQVRGPVQVFMSQSVEPVTPQELTITRVAITKESDAENKTTEMGNKFIIPYGLYRCEGSISANLARRVTGFSEEDLDLFWNALLNMFENDRSAARGKMSVRKLIIFKHDSELGNARIDKLMDAVKVVRKNIGDSTPARHFEDYVVNIDTEHLPSGVHCEIRD